MPLQSSLFYFLYSWILWPILFFLFQLAGYFDAKIKAGLQMRKKEGGVWPWLNSPPSLAPVWIHCASFEFEYAKPVITQIKKSNPECKILVTYFSPTVAKAAQNFPGVDFACPLPWDTRRHMLDFLNHHRPKCLLIARTDAWPEMVRQSKTAKLPIALFSATFSENSGRMRGFGAWASRIVLKQIDQIFVVDQEDEKVLASIGVTGNCEKLGDTRFDQVRARLQSPKPVRDELFHGIPRSKILVAGSTWEEDEAVLLEVIQNLKENFRFILVPHEPTPPHLESLEKKLQALKLSSVRYSQCSTWPEGNVLIIDQLGILAELYLKGGFAFVGGSFKKTVHSVMEPLAAGCVTFVGPLHENNREAIAFRDLPAGAGLTMVQPAKNAEDLIKLLKQAAVLRDGAVSRIKSEIDSRSGKSTRVTEWALRHDSK